MKVFLLKSFAVYSTTRCWNSTDNMLKGAYRVIDHLKGI